MNEHEHGPNDASSVETVSVQICSTEDDDDKDGPTLEERCDEFISKSIDTFCVWDCCDPWNKFQSWISSIVFDPFFVLFIALCVVVNILFLALDLYGMDRYMENILNRGNYFLTATFTIEAMMKLCAMSPKFYFQAGLNIIDFIIVELSLFELSLKHVEGLSVLQMFRWFRIFKLTESWPSLNLLVRIMSNSPFVVWIMSICIFAFSGMLLFEEKYVVRFVSSGYDKFVIGNIFVLILILASLMSIFGSSSLSAPTQATNKIAEAFARIGRFIDWINRSIGNFIKSKKNKLTNQISDQPPVATARNNVQNKD